MASARTVVYSFRFGETSAHMSAEAVASARKIVSDFRPKGVRRRQHMPSRSSLPQVNRVRKQQHLPARVDVTSVQTNAEAVASARTIVFDFMSYSAEAWALEDNRSSTLHLRTVRDRDARDAHALHRYDSEGFMLGSFYQWCVNFKNGRLHGGET